MSVNVKTATGLKKISGENITNSKIISALGFTPAQAATVENYVKELKADIAAKTEFSGDYNDLTNAPAISDDQSNTLYIADASGNIIAKVDEEGIWATDVFLQNKSVLAAINKIQNITEDNSEAFLITDSFGNIIFRTDSEGIASTAITIGNKETILTKINNDGISIDGETENGKFQIVDNEGRIALQIDEEATKVATLNAKAINLNSKNLELELNSKAKQIDLETTNMAFVNHKNDTSGENIYHVTSEEKNHWNDKSFGSITDSPLEDDETGVFKIVDIEDRIALQIDSESTKVAHLHVNGASYEDTISGITGRIENVETAIGNIKAISDEDLNTFFKKYLGVEVDNKDIEAGE